ncbi:hypothetical protein RBH26_20875 [Natronolimnohabitans sp. A-GB9]|uniref:hypothetical protein n=1 Tax=Natronolimnohabitans sp. A-GB9 TaxID=3069757 RepID=UPI0027B13B00|nr:hypothetical protein [Natronolimnohabitans sp. A-GB9]MDQ2052899.1 hypothetical protein [Natronolimnohabitans sp. A-GB9]
MTFSNREVLIEVLTHARAQPRCIIEFTTDEDGETTVADITNHVKQLEEMS